MDKNPSTLPPPTSDHKDKVIHAKSAGKSSKYSTLMVTEGDSAMEFALAGLAILGNDEHGILSMKGNPLNVEKNPKKVLANVEIQRIKMALGLQYGKTYTDVKELNYSHLLLMTDQDYGGNHIKGLLINMISTLWPSLLRIKGFMQMLITPIVKALHKQTGTPIPFYSISEYLLWQSVNNASDYTFTYFKGLAAFNVEDSKSYFDNLEDHIRDFVWMDEKDDDAIKLAFSGDEVDARKKWLSDEPEAGLTLYGSKGDGIRYRDFIYNQLRESLLDDLQRSITSMVDGCKRSQRKLVFGAFQHRPIQETAIIVANFCGFVAQSTYYLHGESSLSGVLIKMAQDFTGCNNINLFLPEGNFGTRVQGPKHHGHARYVNAKLSSLTRLIFPEEDNLLLNYLHFGGVSIEPQRFYPIIPMVLVNGSEAITTAWYSFVPKYNPLEIIFNLIRLLGGEEVIPMGPWYKGFKGDFQIASDAYTSQGKWSKKNKKKLLILELPIKTWTQKYEEKTLEPLLEKGEIKKYNRITGKDSVGHFLITMSKDQMENAEKYGILQKFKLSSRLNLEHMNLFDESDKLKTYVSPEQILKDFFCFRLILYGSRKTARLREIMKALLLLKSKVRFVEKVWDGKIILFRKSKNELCRIFKQHRFKTLTSIERVVSNIENIEEGEVAENEGEEMAENEEEEVAENEETGYNYLMSLQSESYTDDGFEKLKVQRDAMKNEFEELRKTSPKCLWLRDLRNLCLELHAYRVYGDYTTVLDLLDARLSGM